MSAVALGTAGLMMVVGTYVGHAFGASKTRAAAFIAIDLSLCAAITNFSTFGGYHVTKIVVTNLIGCLAAAVVTYRSPEKDNKEKFQLPEAIGTHILMIVGTVCCMYLIPALQP